MSQTSTSLRVPVVDALRVPARASNARRYQRRLMGRLALMLSDVIVVQVVALLASLDQVLLPRHPAGGMFLAPALGAAAALAVLVPGAAFGLYDSAGLSPLDRFRKRITVGLMLPWLGLAPLALVCPVTIDVVFALCIVAVLFVPLSLLSEAAVVRVLIGRSAWGADVLVVGSGEAAGRIAEALLAHPETGLRPIGYCGDQIKASLVKQLPTLGSLAEVDSLGRAADAAVIVISPDTPPLDLARLPFGRIIVVPDICNVPAVHLRTCALGGIAGFDFSNPARARSHHHAKRLLDLLVGVPLLFLALPVIACMGLAIWLVSPGPVFYTQRRVGWHGRPVAILKLRSMFVDAEDRLTELLRTDPDADREWQTYMKLARDPRILPVIGNLMRKISIDELPQLWNVVRGDISLVGPRPFPGYHVEKFDEEFQKLRCSVRPGLTGLWQVSARNEADLPQQEAIDTFYIRNWSLWLDLYIIFRTIPAVLFGRGAR